MSDGRIIGAVFARGGSKGIPGKNLRSLGGRPLLVHAIDALAHVTGLERILVSTDDADIARCARAHGAEAVQRPPELATDTSPEWLAWQHLAEAVGADWGARPGDILLSAPTTAPLRSVADLEAAIARLEDPAVDGVFAVTPSARSPYFNMVNLDARGVATLVMPTPHGVFRRQDAPPTYDMTTVVFAMRAAFIRRADRMWAGRLSAIVVPAERALDIDTELDLAFADTCLRLRENPPQ